MSKKQDQLTTNNPAFYWHYAWVIVTIAAVMQMVGASIRMAFGVFIDPLSENFGWGQGPITLAYAINAVVSAIASPLAGWVGDRYGTRKAMSIGGILFILGMMITGMINELWQFYLAFGLLLGVAQSIFLVPLVPGVMGWYRRHLGWGMGILMASWGLGPAIAAPLIGFLIIEIGWQGAFWATATGSAIIMTILIFFYRNTPADAGTVPYGTLPGEKLPETKKQDSIKVKIFASHMKKTTAYYNMSSIHFLGCVGHAIILVYLIPLAVMKGLPLIESAAILTIMALVSVPSRLIVPVLSEKFGVRTIMAIFFFLQGITVVMLFWSNEQWMFYLFAILFGFGYGGETGGFPILNRKYYGHAPQGSPYGFQMLGAGLGMALGGWIGGIIFDITNTYDLALAVSIATSLIGMVSIILLEPTDKLLIPDWETDSEPELQH